ncbi:hypothetical protein P7C70_g32, partial [Phenoliferia sp. Uapishka_3]
MPDTRITPLTSKWPTSLDLAGSNKPCRLEGEVADLVVLGKIPHQIDGTFFRVMTDPFMPPHPQNVPLDGDGNVSAFRIKDGKADFKMRYVRTDRFKLERAAGKALFGLYRNPFTHHPCVRAAIDTTANTNIVYWAGKLLALKESGNPYVLDPVTLETLSCDPYASQITSRTFTAHPKVDPFTEELVTFGYEAKGLATLDIATWTIDKHGKKVEELWIKGPFAGFIHDLSPPSTVTKRTHVTFLCSWVPRHSDPSLNIFSGLNGITYYDDRTNTSEIWFAGEDSLVQEPAFIPRFADASEGDGFIIALVERVKEYRNELVILDTKNFQNPVAFVQLPFHVKAQVHGNWIDAERLTELERRPIVAQEKADFVKGASALDMLA